MSPLTDLLNDSKYGEIRNGLRDKHNKLLDEFNTLKTQCLGEWKLNVHNDQRLQEMQNKMNEFERLQMFKSGYQAELGELICIDLASALQQRLDHILKQSQNNTVGVYSPFATKVRGVPDKKEQPSVNPYAPNQHPVMANPNRMYIHWDSFTFLLFLVWSMSNK